MVASHFELQYGPDKSTARSETSENDAELLPDTLEAQTELVKNMRGQAAKMIEGLSRTADEAVVDLSARMDLPVAAATSEDIQALKVEAVVVNTELVTELSTDLLANKVELVGQMVVGSDGKNYVSGPDLLVEVANLPSSDKRNSLLQRLAELAPNDVFHGLAKLDSSDARLVRPALLDGLLKHDPLLALNNWGGFDPTLTDDEYNAFDEAAIQLQPEQYMAMKTFADKADPRAAKVVEKLLQTNPAELVLQYDQATENYGFTFSADQRTRIVSAAITKCPIQLLDRAKEFTLSVDERQRVFANAFQQNPDAVLKKLKQNPLFLIPPERQILFNSYIETSPADLFEAFKDKLDLHLDASESDQLFTALIQQQPERLPTILESHPTELRRVLPQLATDTDLAAPIMQALTDRFTYPFPQDPKRAIAEQASNRAVAIQIYETAEVDIQQQARTALIEHAADPDFGDATLVETLLEQIKDPTEQVQVREQAEATQSMTAHLEHNKKTVGEKSERNKKTFLAEMTRTYGEEVVQEQLAKIEGKTFVTINIQASQILSFLESGRWQSVWETQYRGGGTVVNETSGFEADKPSTKYLQQRDAVERQLGIRAKGTERDPHPVYGALGYENGKDEVYGAAPDYGDFFIKIKPAVAQDRTSVTAGDTFHDGVSASDRQFSMTDAAVARVKVDLANTETVDPAWSYVDVQILGGVKLEDVESINIPAEKASLPGFQKIIQTIKDSYPKILLVITQAAI